LRDLLLFGCSGPLDFLREFLSCLEFSDFLGLDLDLSTSLGVTAFAGSTLGHGECTEANEGHLATAFQRFGHGLDERIQGCIGLYLSDFGIFRDLGDQI
jgi:hypothetical protein